ncbi:MAG: ABC transporter substrate-binding protein [Deltaproteobacteria bacterium]|nr:ABC transporter substrate-binding protein [Deltaproteobacteria bacterium]
MSPRRALAPLLGLVALAACLRDPPLAWPPRAPGSQRGGVLRLAAPDDVPTLDPALGYDSRSWTYEQHLFETLVTYDDQSRLVPELAEGWSIADDGRTYRFRLHAGVTFSDGTPLTAADAVGSLERVLDPRTRSQGAEYYREIVGAADYVEGRAPHVAGLTAPDATTLAIVLREPDPLFLHKMALLFAAVVPAEYARRLGDDFTDRPIGSGPFLLREWRRGERLVLARNPRYRRADRPFLDGIVEQSGVNGELAWLKFLNDEIDVSGIPPADFPSVRRATDVERPGRLVSGLTLVTNYLGFNCRMPPFEDRRVRQALNYAVNKEGLIALLNGRGTVAQGIVPPGMPGYASAATGYPYDRERARALLREAGQGAGFATELWTQSSDLDLKMSQKVQHDLAAVGVTMEIRQVAWSSFLEAIRRPNTVPLFDLAWSADFPDPSNFLDVLFRSSRVDANNHTFYANPTFDGLLTRAERLRDPAARTLAYAEAERLLVDDAPVIFLYHPIAYVMTQRRVHGYAIHPLLPSRFTDVWLAPEPTGAQGTSAGS